MQTVLFVFWWCLLINWRHWREKKVNLDDIISCQSSFSFLNAILTRFM